MLLFSLVSIKFVQHELIFNQNELKKRKKQKSKFGYINIM
jgi:hypothetical protein